MRSSLMAIVLVFGWAAESHAQELASSIDQLRVLVKAGDRLTVTDSSGQETQGRLVRLAGTSLELDADGTPRVWPQDRMSSIRLRHQDSLSNGAKIGFGIGAGLGALFGFAAAGELSEPGAVASIVLIYGATGAGIGVGIDGLMSSNRVIFSRPMPQAARLRAVPLVGAGRRGVQLTIGF